MSAKLVVLRGREKGRGIPLPSSQFIIGRNPECHLRPHSEQVSKLHCGIGRKLDRVVVRDFSSRNGTYLNDEPITGTAIVDDGDVLRVGPFQFRFVIDKTSDSAIEIVEKDDVDWLLDPEVPATVDAQCETEVLSVASDEALVPSESLSETSAEHPAEMSGGNYLKLKVCEDDDAAPQDAHGLADST